MKYSTLSSFTDIIPMCRILLVKDDSCNDEESTICHIMNQTTIHRMSFGSSIGCYVTSFHIDNCPSLQKIEIASSSFNRVDLQHTSFAITNCPSLESIDIGDNSFMYFSSCILKGWLCIILFILDLPVLQRVALGVCVFTGEYMNGGTVELISMLLVEYYLIRFTIFNHFDFFRCFFLFCFENSY